MTHMLGLVLGGGGAKGSAHLGVLREFERLGIKPDLIAGTSIGAIIGAVAAAGYGATQIERVFRETTLRRLVSLDPARWGLLGSDRLAEVLYDLLGDIHIEDLPIPFATVSVDLVSGHEIVLDHGSVVEAILASSAVPGVFPPRRVGAYILADGGIRNNVPVNVARRMGAERVIAVNLIGDHEDFAVSDPNQASLISLRRWVPITQLALAERAISILVQQMTLERLRNDPPDLLLSPAVHSISMLALNQVDAGIQAGSDAVTPYADELRALWRWKQGQSTSLIPN